MSSEMQFLCNFTDNSKEIFSNNTVVIYEPSGLAYECYELPPDSGELFNYESSPLQSRIHLLFL